MCVKEMDKMVSLRNYDDKVTDNTDNWVKMELSIVINAHYQQLNKQHPSTFLHCGGADPLYRTLEHYCRLNPTTQGHRLFIYELYNIQCILDCCGPLCIIIVSDWHLVTK